ncbi:hypothetical protein HOLleu_38893 [Holothuria leucospilota]|uniref:Ig-like domain-containing protein n=1 Tax=Holothuria leucospilota TaxID=206669 RepID=A0A9Q1BDX6_HOLLE|nr:hypothetical protein HOLleu_38893 [Holothuria leucospilota]
MELALFLFSVVFYGFSVAVIRIEPSGGGNITEGDELSLSCIMEDPTFGNIDWYKGKVKLSDGVRSLKPDDYNLSHSSTPEEGLQRFVLHVKSVTKYNDGNYKCKASSEDGVEAKPLKYVLSVLYVPHPKYPLCNVSISKQLAICESEKGNPEIRLQWRRQSIVSTDMESLPLKIDKFTHKKIAYFDRIPSPMDLDDAIVCVLHTQPERNCSISLRDVYESFDQPTISSNITVLATESATVSCSTTLNLTNSEFVFQYETFPHNRSLLIAQDDKSILFSAIPVGVEYIQISCLFKWGYFDSLTSELTFITVIQPTTTPNPLGTHRMTSTPVTPSILIQKQSSIQPRMTTTSTTQYETNHNFAALTTLGQVSTDHEYQMSTPTYFQSSQTSSVPPYSSGMEQTEHVPKEVYSTSPPSSTVDNLPKDIFTTDKFTTIKHLPPDLERTSPSDINTNEANTDQLLPTLIHRLSTVSVFPLATKLYTKTTTVNEIKSVSRTVVDKAPPENLVTDFLTTDLLTTTHDSITNPLNVVSTKENTANVPRNLPTEAHGTPSPTMSHYTAPSRVTSMTSTFSKATSDTTSPHEITTPPQSLSSRRDGSLARGTEKAPVFINDADKTKPSLNGKPYTTKGHLNNEQNGKGIAEQGTNKDNEYTFIIYIVIICCGCTTLAMITIYLLRRKKKSREYRVDA